MPWNRFFAVEFHHHYRVAGFRVNLGGAKQMPNNAKLVAYLRNFANSRLTLCVSGLHAPTGTVIAF
jgi:hypothetical protein